MAIYLVNSVIRPLNNLGQKSVRSVHAATWAHLGLNGIRTQDIVQAWIFFRALISQLLKGASSWIFYVRRLQPVSIFSILNIRVTLWCIIIYLVFFSILVNYYFQVSFNSGQFCTRPK